MKRFFFFFLFFFYTQIVSADFYCTILSSDSQNSSPIYSHVWATFLDDINLKQFTISWSPKKEWHILDQKVEGYNKSSQSSVEDALKLKRNIVLFGPYRLNEQYYLKAKQLYDDLEDGRYSYKAIDHRSRKNPDKPALNCIHAVSDVGGYIPTGTKFGSKAALIIVEHFKNNNIIHTISNEKIFEILKILELDNYSQIKRR